MSWQLLFISDRMFKDILKTRYIFSSSQYTILHLLFISVGACYWLKTQWPFNQSYCIKIHLRLNMMYKPTQNVFDWFAKLFYTNANISANIMHVIFLTSCSFSVQSNSFEFSITNFASSRTVLFCPFFFYKDSKTNLCFVLRVFREIYPC